MEFAFPFDNNMLSRARERSWSVEPAVVEPAMARARFTALVPSKESGQVADSVLTPKEMDKQHKRAAA